MTPRWSAPTVVRSFSAGTPSSTPGPPQTRFTHGSATSNPAVAPIANDHLVCYCRRGGDYSGRPDGRIIRAESHDGGRTWSDGKETHFANPNAAVEFLRLQSGNLLLIFNDSTTDRTPLTAVLSTDSDKTYPYRLNLVEGPGDYAYPYAIQADDGQIHLVFTSNERTTIYHAVFEEADILAHRTGTPQ
ncbi:MAG: exo-alpha-sialidase [Planctomycetes bacterium]|nr:exo-alpha-sialidase [Planctomycetota bacterium]